MKIVVAVALASPTAVDSASRLVIDVRDATQQDVSSTAIWRRVLGLRAEPVFSSISGITVECDPPRSGRTLVVEALLDLDGDLRPGSGDFKTMQSYPIAPGTEEMTVLLIKIS